MTGTHEQTDQLRFHCCYCGAGLAIPMSLAGIEGPCPSCFQIIRAPIPEAFCEPQFPLSPVPDFFDKPQTPLFPDLGAGPVRPIPERVQTVMVGTFTAEPEEKSFRATRVIPSDEEPPDDSWKARHRDLQRQTRRSRRVERVAHDFLESRGFRAARVVLILLSAAMLVFLFQYLRNHRWQFPGLTPSIAGETRSRGPEPATRPVGNDVNELMADDDTELPAAAGVTPARPPAGTPATPIANRPAGP